MRRHQLRANRHRDSPGYRATHDAARDHPHRIARGEWNRPFGDEAQAQHQRGFATLLLPFIKLLTGHHRCHTHRQRRYHARCHDSGHRRIGLGTQQANAEGISRFVNRTAHVSTHHATEDRPQQDRIRRTHSLQPVGQARQDACNRFADQVDHRQANHQAGEERNDQDWLQRLHARRQLQLLADRLRHIAGKEARNDTADKAGAGADGQHAANQARGETRTVGNRERNVTCQHRYHQRERRAATDLHQRSGQGIRRFKRFNTKGE